MSGFDFADPESGISASLRPNGAAVIFDHDEVLAASAEAQPHIERDEAGNLRIQLDGASLKLELAPIAAPLALGDEGSGAEELTVCRVLGELEAGGKTSEISCLGIRTEGDANHAGDAALSRSIAVAFADGGILALHAVRPHGAETHAEEEVIAAFADPEGIATPVSETLLSTQYDGDGRQVRATLELWPEQEMSLSRGRRAAGTIVCGTSLALGERRLDLAIFRWSMDGTPGLGRYEVLSGAADA